VNFQWIFGSHVWDLIQKCSGLLDSFVLYTTFSPYLAFWKYCFLLNLLINYLISDRFLSTELWYQRSPMPTSFSESQMFRHFWGVFWSVWMIIFVYCCMVIMLEAQMVMELVGNGKVNHLCSSAVFYFVLFNASWCVQSRMVTWRRAINIRCFWSFLWRFQCCMYIRLHLCDLISLYILMHSYNFCICLIW